MTLRIATWNIDRAKVASRHDSIRAMMAEVKAHIWVLTETRDSICPGPGYHRVAQSLEKKRGVNDERWVSVWVNLPGASPRKTNDEEYAACAVFSRPSGASLAIYGTVLPWRGSVWNGHNSAKALAYGAALNAQSQDWQELRSQHKHLCVAGDFNQALSQPFYYWSNAAERMLRDALTVNDLTATTGDVSDPVRAISAEKAACIDHICISDLLLPSQRGRAGARSPVVDGQTLSDHPIVWLDLAEV